MGCSPSRIQSMAGNLRMTPREEIRSIIEVAASAYYLNYDKIMSRPLKRYNIPARDAAIVAVSAANPKLSPPKLARIFDLDPTSIRLTLRRLKRKPVS